MLYNVYTALQNSLYGVDDVDKANMTCLMWACYHNSVNIAAFLLDKHADKEEKDIDGMTAMHWYGNIMYTPCVYMHTYTHTIILILCVSLLYMYTHTLFAYILIQGNTF